MLYLFDIDGTLLLSGGAGMQALNQSFEEILGFQSAMDGVDPAGKTDPCIVQEAFENSLSRPGNPQEIEQILARYVELLPEYLKRSTGFRLMAGVPQALVRLAASQGPLGVATGNLEQGANIKLDRAGIRHHFSFGGYGSDSSDRATLVRVAADRGMHILGKTLSSSEVIVVGDTPRDVEAARKNGYGAVVLHSGTVSLETVRSCYPDRIIDNLNEL